MARGSGSRGRSGRPGRRTRLDVLVLEDSEADFELVCAELRAAGFDVAARRVDTEEGFRAALHPGLDLVLADHRLPQFDASRALEVVRERGLDIPFVIVSGTIGEEVAVSLMRQGAADYLLKDRLARLGEAVGHALDQRRLRQAHREAEAALRRSERGYRDLFENANDIIYTHDLSGRITSVNRAAERATGYRRDELVGMRLQDLLAPEPPGSPDQGVLRRLLEGACTSCQAEVVARDGHRVPVEISTRVIHEGSGPVGVQGIARDLSERRRAEERIAFLVYHDRLTGLPGRALFEEFLELALARASRHGLGVAVLHVGLDHFKLVNDGLGHGAGDALLREVGTRLREVAAEADLVSRLGGDEFLVLLADLRAGSGPGWPPAGAGNAQIVATSVASRIQEALRAPFAAGGRRVYLSATIGISLNGPGPVDARTMLKNAHRALHDSKRGGPGGYVVFSPEATRPLAQLPLATRLRRAVERERWALRFQPIVDLGSGRMVGAEALVRWADRGRLVGPGEFIPLAEELGLIEAIGDWVLREACRQARRWREEGVDVDTAFNLSPRQLWHPDLVQRVMSRLEAEGVDPSAVVVEVTESTATTDPDRTRRILWDLHRQGVRLAVDDFGTGSSSLSRLHELPIDILKIDRTFVRELPDQEGARTMVRAVVQLAHGLGIVPLAEGIETDRQREFLVEAGCTLGQGFLFSRPVTGREVAVRYLRGTAGPREPRVRAASGGRSRGGPPGRGGQQEGR